MLFGLVRKYTLKRFNFEISGYGLNVRRDLLICGFRFDSLRCRLKSIPCCHEGISLFTLGLAAKHKTVTALRWVAVDMRSQFNFDEVFHFKCVRVFFEW